MELDNLKAFCVAVESGSISKAARKLYISQPSLSVKIQELENYYDATLLHRTNRGIYPTEAGLIVYEHAQKILSLNDSIERSLEQSQQEVQQLVVGTSSTIGNFALPCTVYNFNEKYPHYKVSLIITNTEKVLDNLTTRKVDIGLIEGPITKELKQTLRQEGIKTRHVISNSLILTVPNDESWQHVDKIPLEQITELPLIIREEGSGIRTTLETVLAKNQLELADLNVVMQLNSTNAIISAVASGKGVSFLPKIALRKELHYKICKEVKVEDLMLRHNFTTLYYANDNQSLLQTAFLEFLHSSERGFC
ncbi:MAG: LysR substrate-binding domain-containing protein [Dethiobacteraceae bacterium]|jgi:DNA-binding transcriptional LysR family regulator|nr:LysR family transcriptional regulator [Bacillota bacterium]